MSYTVIFHPEAGDEYAEAFDWYELQKASLGERFQQNITAIIEKLKEHPQYFGYSKKPFREASVDVFPYTIIYKIGTKNRSVLVSAIYHTSRKPAKKYRKMK
jgi:plasmid stabilization system protein ParE